MKPIRIAFFLSAIVAADGAEAQLLEPAPGPALTADPPASIRNLPSFPQITGATQGLPPADPLALDLYRADPKLHARVDFSTNVGIETTLTNPDYLDGLEYRGSGPRLAQGAPFGIGGFDLQFAARLTHPIDSRLSVFSKLGMGTLKHQHHIKVTTSSGLWVSMGATYKFDNGQTLTAELPIGAVARETMTGTVFGYTAKLNLGF